MFITAVGIFGVILAILFCGLIVATIIFLLKASNPREVKIIVIKDNENADDLIRQIKRNL